MEIISKETAEGMKTKTVYKNMERKYKGPRAEIRLKLNDGGTLNVGGTNDESTFVPGGWNKVWKRLKHLVHNMESRDILYRTINEILPTRNRLFKLNKSSHPFCPVCVIKKGPVEGPLWPTGNRADIDLIVGGELGNSLHMFTQCKRVAPLWSWTRKLILGLLDSKCNKLTDKEILWLLFPGNDNTVSVLWIISTYVHIIYREMYRGNKNLTMRQLISNMKVRYLGHSTGRRTRLKQIDFLRAEDFKVP